MFGFLKKKLKETVEKFTKKASDDATEVTNEELTTQEQEQLAVEEQQVQEETISEDQEIIEDVDDTEDESENPPEDESDEDVSEDVEEDEPTPEPVSENETVEEVTTEEPVDDEVVEDTDEDEKITDTAHQITTADEDTVEVIEESTPEEEPTQDTSIEDTSAEEDEVLDEPLDQKDEADELGQEDAEVSETEQDEPEVIEETPEVIDVPQPQAEQPKKKGFFSKLFGGKGKKQEVEPAKTADEEVIPEPIDIPTPTDDVTETIEETEPDTPTEEVVEEPKEETKSESKLEQPVVAVDTAQDVTKKKKGFFGRLREKVVKFKLTEEAFEELFWEFELAMLENNVAVEVIEKIKKDMHDKLTQEQVSRRGIEEIIMQTLKDSLVDILDIEPIDLLARINSKKPFSICVIGVNGAGKTTAIGKLIKMFQNKNLSIVVAASDTFRAAAIQQLEQHTTNLGVKLIKHDYGADPSAVAFDAIKHAEAKGIDVVIIDTAGRLQSNSNLMDELKKLIRVNNPDFKLFVGESITGNDCVEQAVAFNEAVGIDGLLLSKADVDDKGGAAISVSYVTKKPILYLGTGQTYDDLEVFDKAKIMQNLGF